MANIEIREGMLVTECFGDKVQIRVPDGGRVELATHPDHTDVEILDRRGKVERRFRLPRMHHESR